MTPVLWLMKMRRHIKRTEGVRTSHLCSEKVSCVFATWCHVKKKSGLRSPKEEWKENRWHYKTLNCSNPLMQLLEKSVQSWSKVHLYKAKSSKGTWGSVCSKEKSRNYSSLYHHSTARICIFKCKYKQAGERWFQSGAVAQWHVALSCMPHHNS